MRRELSPLVKIDAHHHFWRYDPVEYAWIDEAMAAIRRDFLVEDLRQATSAVGVEGVVSVQARQSLAETEWLLELAATTSLICGVVGWVNLSSSDVARQLESFRANPKLKSVRHVVQGESDPNFILRPDFNRGVRELARFGLAYDILIFERQLPQTVQFVDRHPEQVFVVDHIAKPRIKDDLFEPWRTQMRELARRPNVCCKISGLVTEADYARWTEVQLQRYFDATLDAFGPKRLMFGSDWPVCLVACRYDRWYNLVRRFASALSADEQDWIFGRTAVQAYQL